MSTFRTVSPRRFVLESLETRLVFSSVITSGLPGGIEAFSFPLANATPNLTVSPTAVVAVKSALGGNLNMQSDRIQDHPFTNLVKTTRGFYNLANRLASNGKLDFVRTTVDGWPTEAFTFSLADNSEYGVPIDAGVYKMSFKGPAAVTVTVARNAPAGGATVPTSAPLPTLTKLSYDAATGVHTYNITVPAGVLTLALEFRGTSGSVRDIVAVPPGYNLTGFPTLSNEYLNLLRDLSPNVLRLMDWTQTNNNPVVNWADRTKPTDATQTKAKAPGELVPGKGIAWEYAIELANALNTDVWVNVPARASDDYINNLATLLRNTLKPELNIYLEYSNEVWNTQFDQTKFNTDQAKAEVAANPSSNLQDGGTTNTTTWADRRYARETKELGDRFKAVWAAGGKPNPLNTKVRVMLGGQYANLSRFDNELAYLNKFYGAPKDYLYGIGIAPYINLGGNQNQEGLTKDQVLDSLRGSVTAMRNGTGLANARTKASNWGVKLMAYEGGIDTFGPTSVAAKRSAVLDPAIRQIVEDYLDVWYDKGGNQFNWYTLGARSFNSINGTWSITEDIRNYTQPKEIGFKNVRDLGRGNDGAPEPPPPPGDAPTLSIGDVSANEGNSGLVPLSFTVTRAGNTTGSSTVNFATQNGTAGEGDYQVVTGTVSFGAGETSKSIVISMKGDTKVEGNETLLVNLSGAVGATISDGQGLGTIVNDDGVTPPPPPPPPPGPAALRVDAGAGPFTDSAGNVWAKDAGFVGGGPNTTLFAVANTVDDALYATRRTGTFTYSGAVANGAYNVRLLFTDTNTTTNARTFNVSVEGQSVLTNFDIVANGGSKTAISRSFPVSIADGKLDMAFQSVIGNAALSAFELVSSSAPPAANDPPTLSINDVSKSEGNSGTSPLSFTVTRSGNTTASSSVQFGTPNGSADAADYQAVSGTVSFAPGETSKAVAVNVVGDTAVEGNETFSVVLSAVVGATIVKGQGVGTIMNDDSATPPPPPPAGAVALGGNLQSQNEYTRDHAYADLVKATSAFRNLSGGKTAVDANGWPTQDFVVPLWADSVMDVGRYTVSFDGPVGTVVSLNGGKGTLTKVGGSASVQNYVIDIPSSTNSLSLKLTATSGQVKNLKVVQPNMTSGQVWSTKYVNHLKALNPETLRMMDITKANENTTSTWADRAKTTDANFARAGAAWEHLIDLSNQLGVNIWVNLPVRATDDYVRQLASLLKTRLNAGLKVYVEVANEVWSLIRDPGKYNIAQAQAEVSANPASNLKYDGTTDPEKWAERRYARRMMEVSNLFKEVWTTTFNGTTAQADPINSRVRVILGGQATRPARFDNMLNYINDNYGMPKNAFYGTGLAWYFGLNKYKDVYDSTGTATGPIGLTTAQVLEGMNLSVTAYETEKRFEASAVQAASWGLKLEAYELGVDTFGPMNIGAKANANYDPAISGLMQRFVNAFKTQGGDTAQWYRLGAQNYNTSSGTWGITNDLNTVNSPKSQAFRILRGLPPIV